VVVVAPFKSPFGLSLSKVLDQALLTGLPAVGRLA
jgi:hypothetical protein